MNDITYMGRSWVDSGISVSITNATSTIIIFSDIIMNVSTNEK